MIGLFLVNVHTLDDCPQDNYDDMYLKKFILSFTVCEIKPI